MQQRRGRGNWLGRARSASWAGSGALASGWAVAWAWALGLVLALVPAGGAAGQPVPQPLADGVVRGVVRAGDENDRAVMAFVERLAGDLRGGDAAAVARAAGALIEPLRSGQASVGFRQSMARALRPTIDALVGSAEAESRMVGLRLAGELAEQSTVEILEGAMGPGREAADRLFAIVMVESVFRAVGKSAPAVTPARLIGLAERLGTDIAEDPDPLRVDARVRALLAASEVRGDSSAGLSERALVVLGVRGGAYASGLAVDAGPEAMRPVIRVLDAVRRRLIGGGDPTPKDAVRAAMGMAADQMSRVERRVRQNEVVVDEPGTLDSIVFNLSASVTKLADQTLVSPAALRDVTFPTMGAPGADARALLAETRTVLTTLSSPSNPWGLPPKPR